ncbi:unnamed protein product, partial [Aureobasidium pullulans]
SPVTPPVEPAYRTEIIKTLNEQFAKSKEGIYLRLPQPNPRGHLRLFKTFKWTATQLSRFSADSTLPYDIDTMPQRFRPVGLDIWIFDGRGSTDTSLPEIEMDPLPDLERNKAIVIIDFGIPNYTCVVPPGFVRLEHTGPNKARLMMNPYTATHPSGAREHFSVPDINSNMASTGIEGFTNVYDIMEASAAGDKLRLRRAARKIRLVLMCADNATLDDEHRTALTAILGLLVPSWEEAEKLRLEAAQSYLHVRGKAALCCKNAEARVDDKIRHHILDELTGKQKRSAPPSGLRTLQIQNERQARENLKELGLGYRYAIVKMYPERAFDHPDLKHVLEMRAMELASLMYRDGRYNGFVEVGGCHQLDFLFDGYFEALARHHDMESLEDFDPDIDAMPPSARPSKPAS